MMIGVGDLALDSRCCRLRRRRWWQNFVAVVVVAVAAVYVLSMMMSMLHYHYYKQQYCQCDERQSLWHRLQKSSMMIDAAGLCCHLHRVIRERLNSAPQKRIAEHLLMQTTLLRLKLVSLRQCYKVVRWVTADGHHGFLCSIFDF